MRSVPLELPLRADLAGSLADLIFELFEGRRLTSDVRARFMSRLSAAALPGVAIFPGSLQKDPIHPSTYYIAVAPERKSLKTLLLRVAAASSPSTGIFPDAILIGRMRTKTGREVVINAIPFGPEDREAIRTYAEKVDPAFLPRTQGGQAAIEVSCSCPQTVLPAAFDAFRDIAKLRGTNLAAIATDDFEAILWSAILSGWRAAYTAEPLQSTAALASFSKFTIHTGSASPDALREVEASYDAIQARQRQFDFELALTGSSEPTSPEELLACLQFLRSGGKRPRLVAPEIGFSARKPYLGSLDELTARVLKLAEVARQFNATLSIHHGEGKQREVMEALGKALSKKVNYRIALDSEIGAGEQIQWIAECLFE